MKFAIKSWQLENKTQFFKNISLIINQALTSTMQI
jgi:hypothetical protein